MITRARARIALLACTFLIPPAAALFASESGSASFSNKSSAMDASGRRKTSASYRVDSSIATLAQSTATSASYRERAGFPTGAYFPARVGSIWASSGAAVGSVYIQWVSPGNDGTETSLPGAYVVKYSSIAADSPALSDAKFNAAATAVSPPAPAAGGTLRSMTITGLSAGVTYYFAIKAAERDGTRSVLSAGTTVQSTDGFGCGVVRNVHKVDGPYTTIQSAVNALPTTLNSHACVIIRDGASYPEQVTVQNFTNNGSSISIIADPASGFMPTVAPNAASTAAFVIANASVNIQGLTIAPSGDVAFGVYVSSQFVSISSVSITTGAASFRIWDSGMRLGTWNRVSYSSVSLGDAHGFHIPSTSSRTTISFSTGVVAATAKYALFILGGDTNTVTDSYFHNSGSHGARIDTNARYNVVARSTMTSSASGAGALSISNADYNTISGSYMGNPSGIAARITSVSLSNTISQSTMVVDGASARALLLDASDGNVVTGSWMQNLSGNAARIQSAADNNMISLSTMITAAAGNSALYVNGSDSNTITGSYLEGLAGYGARFDTGADYNTVAQTTMVSNAPGGIALYMVAAAYNSINGSIVRNLGGYAADIGGGAHHNTLAQSSFTSADSARSALRVVGSTFVTVTASYFENLAGVPVALQSGADNAEILYSTIIANASGGSALYVLATDSVSFVGGRVDGGAGNAVFLDAGSDYNTIATSTLTTTGVNRTALYLNAASYNVMQQVYAHSAAGTGGYISNASNSNAVRRSTFSAQSASFFGLLLDNANFGEISSSTIRNTAGTGLQVYGVRDTITRTTMTGTEYGLYLVAAATVSVVDSYVQGATAAFVSGSTGTIFGGSVFAGTGAGGAALRYAGGGVNLTIATSTLLSPGSGRGLALETGSAGVVSLGSVTFSGSARAVEIATQTAVFSLAVDSATFRGLASGATAIHFLGGTFVSTITLANFEDATTAVNVSGAALDLASRVTMRASAGPKQGADSENDPNSLVDWPDLVPPTNPALWFVAQSSIGVQYGQVGADGYVVGASTMSNFTGTVISSTVFGAQSQLSVTGLNPNTTYYLRTGSLWGQTTVYAQTILSTATLTKLATGTTVYQIHVTSMIVNWQALALAPPDASSNSSSGYLMQVSTRSDFSPLWTSSATPNVALSTLAASGLQGGVTYYFRIGGLNWNGAANFAATVSTLMPVQLGVEMTTHTLSLPGLTAMNQTIAISTSIILTNVGNVSETYRLRATTTTPGSPWTIGATQGSDRYVLWTVSNSTQAATIDYGVEDKLSDAYQLCGASAFTMGNQSCVQMPVGGTRTIWLQLATPLATSTVAPQDIRITAEAVKDP